MSLKGTCMTNISEFSGTPVSHRSQIEGCQEICRVVENWLEFSDTPVRISLDELPHWVMILMLRLSSGFMLFWLAMLASLCAASDVKADDLFALRQDCLVGMKRSAEYYRSQVAVQGGYVYYYSLDLQTRWGEGRATATQIWVQPPGTPTVGMAYLRSYEATQDKFYLEAATETAEALIYGQMKSGGWQAAIDFDPQGKLSGQYRHGKGRGKDQSSLDDNKTQSALLLLMQCDRAHKFQHAAIHEAVEYALKGLLAAQFPNGAFPQVWTGPAPQHPILMASFPDYDWKTEHRVKEYWNLYTLNDDLAGDMAHTLLAAHEIYKDDRTSQALRKLGDFLILAQLPEPQPAWAQQYTLDMHPAWARKFEPPAITGHESQDAIATLLLVYRHTQDPKYLEPIPRAIKYLKASLLPDGQTARFYELKTNKPLYMNKEYELTYNDSDVPSHYGWKQGTKLDKLEKEYEATKAGTWTPPKPKKASSLSKEARATLDKLDTEGRWISGVTGDRLTGQPKFGDVRVYLSSEVFSENLEELATFVQASSP